MTNKAKELLFRELEVNRNNTKESNSSFNNNEKNNNIFAKTSIKILNHRDKQSLINLAQTKTNARNFSESRSKETSPTKNEQLSSLKKEIEFIKSKLIELNFESSNKISNEAPEISNKESNWRSYIKTNAFDKDADTKIKDYKLYTMTNQYNYSKSKSNEKKI